MHGASSGTTSFAMDDDQSETTHRRHNLMKRPSGKRSDNFRSANSPGLSNTTKAPSNLDSHTTEKRQRKEVPTISQTNNSQAYYYCEANPYELFQTQTKLAARKMQEQQLLLQMNGISPSPQITPEQFHKPLVTIGNEEMIPLTDHSAGSNQFNGRKKGSNHSIYANISSDTVSTRLSNGTNGKIALTSNTCRQQPSQPQMRAAVVDYDSFRSKDNDDSSSSSNPTFNNPENVALIQNTAKQTSTILKGRTTILVSALTIALCGGSLLLFMVLGIYNRFSDAFEQSTSDSRNGDHGGLGAIRRGYVDTLDPRFHFNSGTHFDNIGRYIVEDYDVQSVFSNFLPGLAGIYGKPLYAFYVNRGQGIASFGIESKQSPIQEYHSANVAYQTTPLTGFRTFLQGKRVTLPNLKTTKNNKVNDDTSYFFIEPFSASTSRFTSREANSDTFRGVYDDFDRRLQAKIVLPKRFMYIGSNEMQLQEIDTTNQIETNVSFFTLPEEDFGAFVRRVVITNTAEDSSLTISVLDGLTQIQPAGGNQMNTYLKNMGRTLEGFMAVYQVYNDSIQMPYYRISSQPIFDAAIRVQEAGHWCLSVWERAPDYRNDLLPIIFDPNVIFGEDSTRSRPVRLYEQSISTIIHNRSQFGRAKTPSAFAALENIELQPGESVTFSTYFGKSDRILDVPVIARRLLQEGFGSYKMTRAREITNQITATVETFTSHDVFNGHIQQMFLDNSLRGGIPFILGEVDDDARLRNADEDPRLKVYHLFSRIHGDLERDTNDFVIKPTFFSEGPSNFKDVIQNRRNDVIFNPRIGSFNVKMFLSFIQADGYEPLTIEAVAFTIKDKSECIYVATRAVGEADGHRAQREALTEILNSGPFRPGQLFRLMEEQNIELMISRQDFIDMVASKSDYFPVADYTTGFWSDHWTYYIDLIESYLKIYPDWEKRIMFEERLPYFFSPAFVNPRDKKFVLSVSFDGKGKHVRQLNSTNQMQIDKVNKIRQIQNKTGWYETECNWQHDSDGELFTSTPIAKLFLLASLKFASRDAYGMGIEYEAGKPGWDEANNGLVGMLGSGMPETYELVVLIRYIHSTIRKYKEGIIIPIELFNLVTSIQQSLSELNLQYNDNDVLYPKVPQALFQYWDSVATARETYREDTNVQFSGMTHSLTYVELDSILEKWLIELDRGIQRAMKFGTRGEGDDGLSGLTPTFFSYNVTTWNLTGNVNDEGHPFVRACEMVVNIFPLFLEGPTRKLKTVFKIDTNHTAHRTIAKKMYEQVKVSALRDKKLRMYTMSASLAGQSMDMGIEMAFAPGWLENQSVWLHMSYKFYLELLRHELYDEFFDEILSGGMLPFMDPNVYGRSLLECSSFISSSAFEDPTVHGRGFLARLSGSTAEFLSVWTIMLIGSNPFTVNPKNGELQLRLAPVLPRWLFRDSDTSTKTKGRDIAIQESQQSSSFMVSSTASGAPSLSFKLFGAIDVTYHHNSRNENLFGIDPSEYIILFRDGTVHRVDGPLISGDLAHKIRRVVFIATIDVFFN